MQVYNKFHSTSASFTVRADRTISAATYRRVRKALCPRYPECKCETDAVIGYAEPIYENNRLVAYSIGVELGPKVVQ